MIITFQDSPVNVDADLVNLNHVEVSTMKHGVLGYVIELPVSGFIALGMGDQVSHVHYTQDAAINWLFVLWNNKGGT